MRAQLQRCHVCGNHPIVITKQNRHYVHCTACGESGPTQGTRDAAAAAWDAIAKARSK